ncbi:hypothetical protein WICMUC_002637 [Wickerhamomyces mucosus]|uniref:Small ribosomal subunit protein bS6m n=1 Tax=Wickerhamomyces mucosus TaxID=1378264 RepID=A0A9P8PNT9_9ASCO|nr:hypothetical protein WICMUC_002637 [Wickerhamomyces mucosus]
MLYELVAISRVTKYGSHALEAKEVSSTIGKLILNNRGIIRNIKSLGLTTLPKIITKDQERHFRGHKFLMLFDSSSSVQNEILRTLKNDPRVIRSLITKVESKNLVVENSIDRSIS